MSDINGRYTFLTLNFIEPEQCFPPLKPFTTKSAQQIEADFTELHKQLDKEERKRGGIRSYHPIDTIYTRMFRIGEIFRNTVLEDD